VNKSRFVLVLVLSFLLAHVASLTRNVWQIRPAHATSLVFGKDTIGSSTATWYGSNNTYACQYTLSETADINSIHLYTRRSDGGTMTVWTGIYNVTDNVRYWLCSSGESADCTSWVWINFTVSPTLRLMPGDYRLAWNCSNSWDISYDSGTSQQTAYRNNIWFPTPFGSVDGYLGMAISVYANYTVPDIITPSNVGWTNPFNGSFSTFHANWTASTSTMDYFIFGSNNTGTFANSSAQAFSGTTWSNKTLTNNATSGNTIQWEIWANDTVGTWASTGLQNLTLSWSGLRAVGNQLYDHNGTATLLKGGDYTYFMDDENGSWLRGSSYYPVVAWSTYNTTLIDWNLDMWKTWGLNCIRVVGTCQLWQNDVDNYKVHINYFVQAAYNRSINVLFTFWRLNTSQSQTYQIPWYEAGNNVINSSSDYQNLYDNVFTTLGNYSNMVFEFWNEPNDYGGNATRRADYFANVQTWITYARAHGIYQLLDVPWDGPITYDFTTGYVQDWAWIATNPITDSMQNLAYDMHCYRSNAYNIGGVYGNRAYLFEDVTTWLTVTGTLSNATAYPLIVGEIGAESEHSGANRTQELMWYNYTLGYFEAYHISYMQWALPPWGAGGGEGSDFKLWEMIQGGSGDGVLNTEGQMTAYRAHDNHPFVWSIGSATDIYSNASATGTAWDGSLNASYSGTCQVRIFWNQSNTNPLFPLESLQCMHSNGTFVSAIEYYDSTRNLIRLNSVGTGSWLIGYGLLALSITSPANTTYTVSTISVEISASGGTIDTILWNCTFTNGTVVYANTVYTSPISMTLGNGSYIFNAKANNTDGNLDEAAVSFSVQISSGVDHYQFSFRAQDLDGNVVNSLVSWKLYNASTLLQYVESEYTLVEGTYTLKTYYGLSLINQTDYATSTYGNSTVHVYLEMKSHNSVSNGYLGFNNTVTSLPIYSQTPQNLTFGLLGSTPMLIYADVPQNASYVQKDGVNQTGWTYSTSPWPHIVIETSSLSTWSFVFPSQGQNEEDWNSGGLYRVVFRAVGLSSLPISNVKVTIGGVSRFTDALGLAVFNLPYGESTVVATFGNETKRMNVFVNGEKTYGLDFNYNVVGGKSSTIYLVVPIVVFLVCIVALMLPRKRH
jgi:hypothetical protein